MKRLIQNQNGFSLLEVLVSMMLFGVVMAGLTPTFAAMLRFNTQAQLRTEAVAVAQQILDEKRQLDISTLPDSGTQTQNVTLDGKSFSARVTYCAISALCINHDSRHIRVEVSWNGDEYFQTETVFTQLR